MSSNNDNMGAFQALVDVAKIYAGAWVVGTALDQAFAGCTPVPEPQPDFDPPPAPADAPDPAVAEVLVQLEDMRKQWKALIDAIPAPESDLPKPLDPPREFNVLKSEPVRRGGVEELNAAVMAYNEAARHLGLMVLAGGIDKRVARGEPEDAAHAISGVIYAAEQLMLLGASLVRKAKDLVRKRKDLMELTASQTAKEKLPILLELADEIDGMLEEPEE